ncbi:MAG TPA: DNA ligase D [Longimicrobiales bacterium]|nr:DNA ligase D [Longimicrobiales bacterium]
MATRRSSRLAEYRRKRRFSVTEEPRGGESSARRRGVLHFYIQKHEASHLHFDLRLELDGVLRSWAVPKGPSLDPAVKRLALEVEDHPLEYGTFEGTIPEGEYGGGTVMLWDRGTYRRVEPAEDEERALRRDLARGRLSILLDGERLRGGYALVRTSPAEDGRKAQWLLIKERDEHADGELDPVAGFRTSVASGQTMAEIAAGTAARRSGGSKRRTPKAGPSSHPPKDPPPAATRKKAARKPPEAGRPETTSRKRPARGTPTKAHQDPASLAPMLAMASTELPQGPDWTFEPKYDGIRVLAFAAADAVALVTRNGRDKARQFPEVVASLRELGERARRPFLLDGEIVATNGGTFGRFEALQARMHLASGPDIRRLAAEAPAAFVAFDVLVDGDAVLVDAPWTERRRTLEALLEGEPADGVRLAPSGKDGEALLAWARREGWEGVVAKRTDAPYRPGTRSPDWRKVKAEGRQELVVGGYTEPRRSRKHLGAILLGYYDGGGAFHYAGHTGAGFSHEALESLHRKLRRLERRTSPFVEEPDTNERAHWVTPRIVVEVKFNEWTSAGRLRQPVFLGVRDDKDARSVVREAVAASAPGPIGSRLAEIRADGGTGLLNLGPRARLEVTNLDKEFFPRAGLTKGDLLAYYARMAPFVLPAMKDRPLVLKRFPNGAAGKAFYQQSAPDTVPPGVRVETLAGEDGAEQRRLVGGSLATLLYTVQLGAISYDPWHSRVGRLDYADYTILDLDPGPKAPFRRVVHVAWWVREELERLGLAGALKTSGASGLHVYLPLPPRTPLEAARLIAQVVASRVAQRHPKEATVERMTRKRPAAAVYVDYLQNVLAKTVAGVYAVRATEEARVSTPLDWEELTEDLDPRDFTLRSVPDRVGRVGDVWAAAMKRRNSLDRLLAAGSGG